MEKEIFNGFNLKDEEILDIINYSMSKINQNSRINGIVDEDLKQEIIVAIYEQLTQGRRK